MAVPLTIRPLWCGFPCATLVAEVMDMASLEAPREIEFVNAVSLRFEIAADREQMFRVLTNLVRNGVQALEIGQAGVRTAGVYSGCELV